MSRSSYGPLTLLLQISGHFCGMAEMLTPVRSRVAGRTILRY